MKGFHTDLRNNIGKKIIVKSTGNSIKYGTLLLRNYSIIDSNERMEVETQLEI